MPKKEVVQKAREDKKKGKAPSTQAGEFVREEMHRYKTGEGAKSPRQAVAIGLSEARRAGVDLPPPSKGAQPERVRKRAEKERAKGQAHGELSSKKRR